MNTLKHMEWNSFDEWMSDYFKQIEKDMYIFNLINEEDEV